MSDLKELFNALSDGKKRVLVNAYTELFGRRSTFYNKINGVTKLRNSEILFFAKHLNEQPCQTN